MKIERNKNSHKGSNGRILIIGGSELYTGAPALAALAALRTGADLVHIAAPQRAADACASFSPDLITVPLTGKYLTQTHLKTIEPFAKEADCVLIGPGLGRSKETEKAVLSFIKTCKVPLVIDADALKAVSTNLKAIAKKECVLTPHRKEFELLSGKKSEAENVRKFAAHHNAVVILKAPTDVIADDKKVKFNTTGNAGMTVGGTGDVLAGVVAGLIAQGLDLFDAALKGAKINGIAGDGCKSRMGYGFTASDLLEEIPAAMKFA